MTEITDTIEHARVAAETEASKEIMQQAAPDSPNPDDGRQTTEDGSEPLDPSSDLRPPSSDEAPPLQRVTAFDRGRADIAARFREKRAAQGGHTDYHGDYRDLTQTYGEVASPQMSDDRGRMLDDEGPTSDIPTQSAEPRLIRVKVHGREALLPEADVIAEAQKSLAAGNLLETAKEFLQGAKQTADDGQQRTDQTTDDRGQTTDEAQAAATGDPSSVVRPPSSAEIERRVAAARSEAIRAVRIDGELAASQRAVAAFEQTNPDLAGDEFARDAITTQIQREINADLSAALKSGVLGELPRAQEERNGLHTQLRAFGAPVRGIAEIMESAKSKYASWRGDKPSSAHPLPNPPPLAGEGRVGAEVQGGARVELSPDRVQRRAAIPSQPSRASMPPRPVALSPEPSQAQKRSAAVMAMRKARGQVVA